MRIDRTWLAVAVVVAIGIHSVAFLLYAPGDLYGFLRPWYRELLANGFSRPFGNYAPTYLYLLWFMTVFDGLLWQIVLIKLLSVAGAISVAFAVSRVLKALDQPRELSIFTLLLPSIILDASLLGQADTFWVAPCVLATAAAIEGKHVRVAAWAGLAFSVKMQAAVFAPFVIYLFVRQSASAKAWLAAPATFIAAWFPAWVMGWPLAYLATIYLHQFAWAGGISGDYAGFHDVVRWVGFVGNGASLWTPLGYLAPNAAFALRWWIGAPLLAIGLAAYWRFMPNVPTKRQLLIAAIISAVGIPFLAPGMLDRFFILADVLAFAYAISFPSRRSIIAAVAMQIASALPIFVWSFRLQPLESPAFLFGAVAIFLFAKELFEKSRRVNVGPRLTLASRLARPILQAERGGKGGRL